MFSPLMIGRGSRLRATLRVSLFLLAQAVLSGAIAAERHTVSEAIHAAHEHSSQTGAVGEKGHADQEAVDEHNQADARLGLEHNDQNEAGQDHKHDHDNAVEVHLSPEQRRMLAIEVSILEPRVLGEELSGPGEVRLNAYATARVTPRIEAQVMARHARLGERVEQGQPLLTLSSVEMAEAQGDLIVAEREWQRLTKLKGQFVSESDYLEASVARQKAFSRVLAFGMSQPQADALIDAASEKADGTFELLAPQGGTVVQDAFILGELVAPGRVLFEITDESVRWVEARMPPEEAARAAVGDRARIANRETWLDGRVTQIHHLLDETTRTQALRIEVPDPKHRLHPGIFVDVLVFTGAGEPILAVPEAAVLKSGDGDWHVFVAEGDDAFKPVEVALLRTAGGMAVIEGVPAGTHVVTRGAFFLQSELAKGGFDPHNH